MILKRYNIDSIFWELFRVQLPEQEYELKVYIDGTICDIYVSGDVAMSARMYDIQQGKLAIFVSQGAAEFHRVKIETLEADPAPQLEQNIHVSG
ncbi:DUF4975 domain-containing protein [Paenibacillus sp. P46E]|uniref:DUF4975 domain-containing protein n=1 Tax=Paenibacillus sp. P46E TaxID=1349436 RepID=UPI000938E259|nr:DUF4975 domain-containing protein [Paenibacillus sp. P46E]OKP95206.1 hypothetical protein A3849_26865 [Paenibacillus sp. P46E]